MTARPGLLLVPEVAEQLRKSERFVADELRRGRLRGSKFGGEWHVNQVDLDAYVDAHLNVPSTAAAPRARRRRARAG